MMIYYFVFGNMWPCCLDYKIYHSHTPTKALYVPEIHFKYYISVSSHKGSSTLPRAQTRATDTENRTDKVTAATSSTSLYDNVGAAQAGSTQGKYLLNYDIRRMPNGNSGHQNFSGVATKGAQREGSQIRQTRDRGTQQQSQDTSTMTSNTSTGPKTVTASIGTQNTVGSQVSSSKLRNLTCDAF